MNLFSSRFSGEKKKVNSKSFKKQMVWEFVTKHSQVLSVVFGDFCLKTKQKRLN